MEKDNFIPLFPDYLELNVEDNIYTFKTNIYIHKESEEYVKVYLYCVEGTYVAKNKTEKQLVIKSHLRECLRLSKYLNTTYFDTSLLPFVDSLNKRKEDKIKGLTI